MAYYMAHWYANKTSSLVLPFTYLSSLLFRHPRLLPLPLDREASNFWSRKMTETRAFDSEGAQPTNEAQSVSEAVRFNARTLQKLQAALAKDLEVDLVSQFPTQYLERLLEMRTTIESPSRHHNTTIQSLLIH